MHRSWNSLFAYVAIGIGLATSCAPQEIEVPDDDGDNNTGTGASQGSGGSFGGTPASGGTFGGTPASGGTFGGTPATGGFAGTPATGGTFAGTPATGGTFPTGGTAGTPATGGTLAGTPATGGAAAGTPATGGTGGSAPGDTCSAAWAVGSDGFVRAPVAGMGCWHGYAYSAASPATGTGASTIVPAMFNMCMTCQAMGLCASGTVGAADASVALIGFNLNQASGSTATAAVTPTGAGLTVNFTKTGTFPMRVQIQDATGATMESGRWCFTVTAAAGPITIPYASFNTKCWDNSGVAYAKTPITAVMLLIPGSPSGAATFNACLTGVTDS